MPLIPAPIPLGAIGPQVTALQTALAALGFSFPENEAGSLLNNGTFGPVTQAAVVLENNNEHLKQRSAEGLPLFPALLSSRQEVVLVSCLWVGPGAPGSAAVQSVRPSAR
jgi:peptidoglycan hydrolase-like protein with peptidoglycan-binding domain